jgi:hypothetical protein
VAFFADTGDFSVLAAEADTRRSVAFRADKHDVGNMDGGFKFDDARVDVPASGLGLTLVLGTDVYTLNDYT